jgi:hypothetical protein
MRKNKGKTRQDLVKATIVEMQNKKNVSARDYNRLYIETKREIKNTIQGEIFNAKGLEALTHNIATRLLFNLNGFNSKGNYGSYVKLATINYYALCKKKCSDCLDEADA